MFKQALYSVAKATGFDWKARRKRKFRLPPDLDLEFEPKYRMCAEYTMLSWERLYSVYTSVQYVMANRVPGDIVECGVWRGGCCLLMAETMAAWGDFSRDLWLYDTFTGMAAPDGRDVKHNGVNGVQTHRQMQRETHNDWCFASLEEVKANVLRSRYPAKHFHFVKGKVEETIPKVVPEQISLLRLDTDWYASTHHELVHLWPRLVRGGVLIIDDYGVWKGARKAVDTFLAEHNIKILLQRVDASAVGVKLD